MEIEIEKINNLKIELDMEEKNLKHEINVNRELLTVNNLAIEKILNNNYYKNYIDNNLNINNLDDINKVYEDLKKHNDACQKELFNIDLEIENLKKNIEQHVLEDIIKQISNTQNNLNEIQKSVNLYVDQYIKYFGNSLVSVDILKKEITILENNMKSQKNKSEFLGDIINILSPHINNSLKVEKEKERLLLNNELNQIRAIINKVITIKDDSHFYIKQKIERVFNLKSVNKIFQMIDPHPKLTEILFKLDESLKDGLGLNIKCKDSENLADLEAPILYLSSAQINILSMSIFLASAVENTSEIDTILMDDPIQHLDGLNLLSFIDLLRIICFSLDKQIIISTHDERFFKLLQKKIDPEFFSAKYLSLNSTGQLVTT